VSENVRPTDGKKFYGKQLSCPWADSYKKVDSFLAANETGYGKLF
jgi:hypothetical protein